jgi:hypothetical protein
MWEDDANRRGGKLSMKLRKGMGSPLWEEVLLAMIGEGFDGVAPGEEVCGAVLSVRFHDETLSVWNRSGDNEAAITKIRCVGHGCGCNGGGGGNRTHGGHRWNKRRLSPLPCSRVSTPPPAPSARCSDTLLRTLCVPHYLPQLFPEYHRHGGRSAAKAGGAAAASSGALADGGAGRLPYPSAGQRADDGSGGGDVNALPSPDAVSSWRGGVPAAAPGGSYAQQEQHHPSSSAAAPPPHHHQQQQHAGAAGAPPSIGKPSPWAKPGGGSGAAPAGSPTHAGLSGASPPASPLAPAGHSATSTAGATVSSSPSATAPKRVGGWAAAAAASPPAAAPAAAAHSSGASSGGAAGGAAHGASSGSAKPSTGGGQSGAGGGSGDHRKGGSKSGGHTVDRPVPVQAPPASASPAAGEDDGWHTVSMGTKPSSKR